ncbi:hypothetical protein PILCRDRAFT_98206 [Piloderma croceum F 1598]|uniref:PIN domain-containing protein n=1 Tax=Piloderma croceum (strain F 1598) TaxID=765440 RepID=A0A0C3FI65_PILCF|nr:hypothetical protein PILCRDRAFT_98206 [Piloderma croceum F 1598]
MADDTVIGQEIPATLGPTAVTPNNKLAMSRALGAAFLNHQVEQLEKSVTNGAGVGNWRDRRQSQADHASPNGRGANERGTKRSPHVQGGKPIRKKGGDAVEKEREKNEVKTGRKSVEEPKGKDAVIVVVDSSVLVNALYQVKKWCKEGREEILIVPLEALNTLDLLKKGTSALAQRARAASRILEAQVGTNPRIRVQRDDAFVPWDNIPFKDVGLDGDKDRPTTASLNHSSSPEWVRRTICCARWEIDNANESLNESKKAGELQSNAAAQTPKVVLAVLASTPTQTSAYVHEARRSDGGVSDIPSPVPLPAPNPHTNKHEPRTTGLLVHQWATRADINMIEVQPSAPNAATLPQQQVVSTRRASSEEERPKRQGGRGRRNSQHVPSGPGPVAGASAGRSGLVERPPAVMAMMEMVAQPSKVVRVLARGEKLDPDP